MEQILKKIKDLNTRVYRDLPLYYGLLDRYKILLLQLLEKLKEELTDDELGGIYEVATEMYLENFGKILKYHKIIEVTQEDILDLNELLEDMLESARNITNSSIIRLERIPYLVFIVEMLGLLRMLNITWEELNEYYYWFQLQVIKK